MMQWALLVLAILFLIVAYIIVQGTRAALAWRQAAAAGDVNVIRDIVEDALRAWRSMKRPKEVATEVWRGIQSMQAVDVGADFVRVSCQAESEYKLLDRRWIEVRNPLQEGMAITARAADMLLYELPHFRPDRIQIDVYTTYREADGATKRDCILSTATSREVAKGVDWEEWTSEQIVEALGGRYRLSGSGRPLPVRPAGKARVRSTAGNGRRAPASGGP